MKQFKLALGCVLLAISLVAVAPAKANSVPDNVEFALLKKFYDSLGGNAWTRKTNWPATGSWPATATSAQFATWYGITVVNGDITQIVLSNNRLTGKIPSNIGDLSALKVFDLNTNASLSGSIPSSLATIAGVQQVTLYRCALTGTIPPAIFNNTGLQEFNISYNSVTGTIPSNVVNATALVRFIVASNQLTGPIPADIGNLTNLQYLTLWGNALSGTIPISLTNLFNLTSLRLDDNRLTGPIPEHIGNLTKLTQFYLSNNLLTGELPPSLENLTNITDLQLYTNNFTGPIPSGLGKLTKLTGLRLDDNQLTGQIPTSLGNLAALTTLYLFGNKLSGSIPGSLGNLTNLTNLYLYQNNLSGEIPATLGNLKKLQYLYLQYNQLAGKLPAALGNQTALITLNASFNSLSGEIPGEYGNLKNLQNFYLQNNKLSGSLPAALSGMTQVRYFYVNDNSLTGAIPVDYAALTQLVSFYLHNNQLAGEIPTSLTTNWIKLAYFYVQNNKFTGNFPSSVGSSPALAGINASGNRFATLPSAVVNLAVLAVADFSNNELTTAPDFSSHPNKSNLTLRLHNNRLDFSVLEPLVGSGVKLLAVTPQKEIIDITSIKATDGDALVIPARDPGAHGVITWEKQGPNGSWRSVTALNEDLTNKTFTRNVFVVSDEGVYRWKMTNTAVAGVTIQSDLITVKLAESFTLDNWAYQYRYDERERMIGKKLPGAEWIYMVYDNRDRLVMTQDGEQRKADKWMYTVYDALNRPVLTGIYTHSKYLSQAGMDSLISKTVMYETYTGTGANHGYSSTVFASANFNISGFDTQTVTYYDNYDFKAGWGSEYDYVNGQVDSVKINDIFYSQPRSAFTQVIGQITGVKTKTLEDQSRWLYTANYYDDRYRVIQAVSDNLKGGVDRITNLYDFTGKVLSSKSVHGVGKLTWQNMVATNVDDDNLVKTTSAQTWGNSGASSVEQIAAGSDGWAEVTVSDLTSRRMFGLSNKDVDQNFTKIKYAFYLNMSILTVYVDGNPAVAAAPITLTTGDRLRIAREGGYINFYRNGIKVYPTPTAAQLSSTESLLVDVALGTTPGALRFARISAGQTAPNAVTRRFEYDHAGRLLKTRHAVNGGTEVLLAENEYNELGQLISKKLHSEEAVGATEHKFKQKVDYRYNIRGWLTSINNATLTSNDINPAPAGTPRDLFGMELSYNEVTDTQNKSTYNGNISAMKWSNSLALGDVKQNAYNYNYDPMNRLASADFRQKKSAWGLPEYKDDKGNTYHAAAYSEAGYEYDLNGNILRLKRKTAKGEDMDVLTYDYGLDENKSNKLLAVKDSVEGPIGFIDGNTEDDDYAYDANGSMTNDLNKSVTAITYNHLHLPYKVTKNSGDYITYTYDAIGRKLRQQVFNVSAVQQKRSDYAGEYFYENDTLKFINHDEGRIVTTGSAPEYQYFLKDHLGNVRLTFTTKTEIDSGTATMEPGNAEAENAQYLNYVEAVVLNSPLFDHTHTHVPVGADPTYYSTLLRGESGAVQEKYGLARSLSVMPGDTVKMDVFAKYIALSGTTVATQVQNVLTAIANGSTTNGPFIDGGAAGSLGGRAFPFIGLLTYPDEPEVVAPQAYLNWLVFDRNFKFLNGGFQRVSTAAAETGNGLSQHEHLAKDLLIQEAGYVYIYLSNEGESPVDVFFDDFGVDLVKGPVVQMEDYYPFGLAFNSYQRENSTKNNYLYNGKELQDELALNVLDFGWRTYDPTIGRFSAVDAFADKYFSMTPYQYGANNPIKYVDINGDSLMLFKNGAYVATVDNGKEEITGYNQLSETDEDGNETFTGGYQFGFNDIDTDRSALKSREMTVELISNDAIESASDGAREAMGDENRYSFIKRESRLQNEGSKGKMDFWATSDIMKGDNVLHVARSKVGDAVGYNGSDFGNFMWGMAGRKLGFNLTTLRLGAHYNNMMNGKEDNKWNKKYEHQILDAAADQRAIRNGYNYNQKFQENGVVFPRD